APTVGCGRTLVGLRVSIDLPQRRDGCACRYRLGQKCRPAFHQLAPFLEGVTTAICLLDSAAGRIRQGGFADLVREVCSFTGPIAKRTSEAVYRNVVMAKRRQKLSEGTFAKSALDAREHVL